MYILKFKIPGKYTSMTTRGKKEERIAQKNTKTHYKSTSSLH